MIIPFELNGETIYTDSNPNERLLTILRNRFKLLGTKEGCLSGKCGTCMVLLNGKPAYSCMIPIFLVRNSSIITIEHFEQTQSYRDIMEGFTSAGIHLCGYCNAGKIFMTHYIIENNQRPTSEEIREKLCGISCQCTSIEELILGIKNAASIIRKKQHGKK